MNSLSIGTPEEGNFDLYFGLFLTKDFEMQLTCQMDYFNDSFMVLFCYFGTKRLHSSFTFIMKV